jgi:hypothetical protein
MYFTIYICLASIWITQIPVIVPQAYKGLLLIREACRQGSSIWEISVAQISKKSNLLI